MQAAMRGAASSQSAFQIPFSRLPYASPKLPELLEVMVVVGWWKAARKIVLCMVYW